MSRSRRTRRGARGTRGSAATTPATAPAAGPAGAGAAPATSARRPRRRDRRGRGLRGAIAPREVPLHRTRSESFDELVAIAVEDLEAHWASELAALEFAVEDVPPGTPSGPGAETDAGPDAVTDRGVLLGRLFRDGLPTIPRPVVVLYRRPIEARAMDVEDCADLVFMVVVDLVAEYLGKDVEDLDP